MHERCTTLYTFSDGEGDGMGTVREVVEEGILG